MRVDLPLGNTGVATVVTVNGVPPGMYDELEFEIHRPSASRHAAFLQANPDLAGASVRVEGSFSRAGAAATPFVFTSDLEEDEEEDVALQVTGTGTAGITLRLDVAHWFMVDGRLIDPMTANDDQPNEDDVSDNISAGFAAFQDDNQDGVPDIR